METQVTIIGAGPAGLAVGACLRTHDVPFRILEQHQQVGASWRRHYDRLHLHTDKTRSALPHFPFPHSYPRYPSREQMIAYLESYAQQFGLAPRFGERVVRAYRATEEWHIQTDESLYRSKVLVVATGYARKPVVPRWPGQAGFRGRILHSSQYKNGAPFAGKRVLVVGFGNSGGEITIDLSEHGAHPSLSVRSPVNVIPRDLFGLPLLAISIPLSYLPARLADLLTAPILRWKFGALSDLGLQQAPYGPFTQIERDARIPLIDVGTVRLLREKVVTVYPAIERFTKQGVVFQDTSEASFEAVVLATGYRPAVHEFLEDTVIPEDDVSLRSGDEVAPGLYLCCYRVSARSVLNDIADEAKRIARDIARRGTP